MGVTARPSGSGPLRGRAALPNGERRRIAIVATHGWELTALIAGSVTVGAPLRCVFADHEGNRIDILADVTGVSDRESETGAVLRCTALFSAGGREALERFILERLQCGPMEAGRFVRRSRGTYFALSDRGATVQIQKMEERRGEARVLKEAQLVVRAGRLEAEGVLEDATIDGLRVLLDEPLPLAPEAHVRVLISLLVGRIVYRVPVDVQVRWVHERAFGAHILQVNDGVYGRHWRDFVRRVETARDPAADDNDAS